MVQFACALYLLLDQRRHSNDSNSTCGNPLRECLQLNVRKLFAIMQVKCKQESVLVFENLSKTWEYRSIYSIYSIWVFNDFPI